MRHKIDMVGQVFQQLVIKKQLISTTSD